MSVYNGWTPTIPLKTRLENLLAQVPQEHRNRAAADCACDKPHDFERNLTAYVLGKKWLPVNVEQPHPAEVAYRLEKAMDAELADAISAAVADDFTDDWCDERLDNGLRDDAPYRPASPFTDDDLPF